MTIYDNRDSEQHPTPPRIIKRYPNRKLYDMRDSCYITLDEIADIIRDGEDVRIFDTRTHEDLTSVTLTQIIFQQEKKEAQISPRLLTNLIRNRGVQIGDHIRSGVQHVTSAIRRTITRNNGEMPVVSPVAMDDIQIPGTTIGSSIPPPHPPRSEPASGQPHAAFQDGDMSIRIPATDAHVTQEIPLVQPSPGVESSPRTSGGEAGDGRVSSGAPKVSKATAIQQTLEQLSALSGLAGEMMAMEQRIRELEARLEELDNE